MFFICLVHLRNIVLAGAVILAENGAYQACRSFKAQNSRAFLHPESCGSLENTWITFLDLAQQIHISLF